MIADIRRFMPDLHFRPVADAGHGIVLEKPDPVNDMVLAFLQGEHHLKGDFPQQWEKSSA